MVWEPEMARGIDDRSLRLIAERAHDLIYRYRVAPEPGFEYLSPSAERLLGYTADELLDDPELVMRIVTPEHVASMDGLAADEWSNPRLVRVRRKDGTTTWMEERLTPVYEDGHLVAVEGIARDVTARKQAEDLLALREHQLAEAQALAHVGSWEWDIGTNVVSWSDEMFRIYGFDPGAVVVTYDVYVSYIHPEDRHIAEGNVAGTLETGQPFASDYRIVRPSGEVRWLHSRGDLTVDADGRPLKLTGVCHDVTERKEMEEHGRRLEAVELRHRQAMDIHDNIVQGLAVASMAFELGEDAKGMDALTATLAIARQIVSANLATEGYPPTPQPGDLRRATPALLD